MLSNITNLLIAIALFILFLPLLKLIFYVLGLSFGIFSNLFYLFTYIGGSCDTAFYCSSVAFTIFIFFPVVYFYRKFQSS